MINLRRDFEFGEMLLVNFVNLIDADIEMVRKWRNHENVRKWMYSDHIITPEEHREFIKRLKEDNKNFYWILKHKRGDNIGVISLNRIDFQNKNAYIGIYSNPDRMVPGTGDILIKCLKDLGFNILDLHTLKLEVFDNNERAFNFYKKSGFNEEGRLKEFVIREGIWHDAIVMGILNENKGQAWN